MRRTKKHPVCQVPDAVSKNRRVNRVIDPPCKSVSEVANNPALAEINASATSRSKRICSRIFS
jgi:hypothetical protein